MAKAKKLASGNWRCLVYDYTDADGKRHYESFTATSKKVAEFMAADYALNKNNRKKVCDYTIDEACIEYIDSRQNLLSPTTQRSYKAILRNNFTAIKSIKLAAIDQQIIQKWVNELSINLSPKTVSNAHGLLSAVLSVYMPDLRIKTSLPRKIKPDLYTPSDSDVKCLLEHVKGSDLEVAILLAAFGTLRRGELCAIESSDIHENILVVNKSMVRSDKGGYIVKSPKTYSSYREIEMPDFVIERIKGIEGRLVKTNPEHLSNYFLAAVNKCGLPHFRLHDLRHYSASIMHALGIPDQYIMQRGGWGSDGTLKAVYRNVIDCENKKFVKGLNDHFESMQHEMQHKKNNP